MQLGGAFLVVVLTITALLAPSPASPVRASPTSREIQGSEPTSSPISPTPTIGPTVTLRPTSTPTPSPSPTVIVNGAVAMDVDADGLYVLAALIQAEAGGMGARGQYLVACNVLHDLYDVGGRWCELTGRWSTLGNVLADSTIQQPQAGAFSVANGAADGLVCAEYPRCRHLGSTQDLYTWMARGYVDPGTYQIWLGASGQMLVCVPGIPAMLAPPGK